MSRPLALSPCLVALGLAAAGLPHRADARPFTRPSDDLKVQVGAMVQPRVSFAQDEGQTDTDRFGFGLRRARLRASGQWGAASVEIDFDFASLTPFGLYASVHPAAGWTVRAGYFPGVQPRGMALTGATVIDGVERSAIAERWAAASTGGPGRDVGADVSYANAYVKASLWLHSGLGGIERAAANFSQSPSSHDVTRGVDRTAIAVSGSVAVTPHKGLELGGFGSYNPAGGRAATGNTATEGTLTSWGAHAYWGAKPGSQFLRLKAEVVGLAFTPDNPSQAMDPMFGLSPVPALDRVPEFSQLGAAGTAAVAVLPHTEVFGRFEIYDEDTDDDEDDLTRYLTAGLMVSLSAMDDGPFERERLTLAYSQAVRAGATDHISVLQGQWLF